MKKLFLICGALVLAACTTTQLTNAGQIVATGTLALSLRNNPKYIPEVQQIATDLQGGNYTDLTTSGLDAAVAASVAKVKGGTPADAIIIESLIVPPIVAYVNAAATPNLTVSAVTTAIGNDLSTAVALAQANPK